MTISIEIGGVYYLDGEFQVKVLKAINRSKTIFSAEKENGTIETVQVERLSAKDVESHSMPDVYNGNSDE